MRSLTQQEKDLMQKTLLIRRFSNPDKKRLTTAIYARKSSEDENATSIDTQITDCRLLIQENADLLELDEQYIYKDEAKSGMFQDNRWIFVVLTSLMIIAIILYMFIKRPQGKLFYVLAGLIIGGGIGNLIDRILYGYVIDYLSLSFFPPVCNFADYCITGGVIALAVYIMIKSAKGKKEIKND
jgi:signal peptidase II